MVIFLHLNLLVSKQVMSQVGGADKICEGAFFARGNGPDRTPIDSTLFVRIRESGQAAVTMAEKLPAICADMSV